MSDTGKKETLSLGGGAGRLGMRKSIETGQVKQSFSHGRSKTVQVEVRKKRSFSRAGGQPAEAEIMPAEPAEAPSPPVKVVTVEEPAPETAEERRARHVLPTLSEAEKATRAKALEGAQRADQVARARAGEDAKRRVDEEARVAVEREASEHRQKEEAERKRLEDEARRRAEEDAERRLREQEARDNPDAGALNVGEVSPDAAPASKDRLPSEAEIERIKRGSARPRPAARRGEPRRRAGRLTVSQALDDRIGEDRVRSLASVRRERERQKQERARQLASGELSAKVIRDVVVPDTITVQELANRMAERGNDVIKALMKMGIMATMDQDIDADTAELVVTDLGHRVRRVSAADVEIGISGDDDESGDLLSRPPVVTVMGHVDHGKTSLLDALRKSDVARGEAGGITQHIGAYQATTAGGDKITFIDTPGHEAFTAMRARGAKVTDLVILVVAADDSVMPQTVEAINHAKAADVPIIVAVNKIDRPDANPARVKQDLLQHGIVVEEMSGDVLCIEVSAVEGTNLDKLLEAIALQAELLELTANPNREAHGIIVEAKLERGRGAVVTALVQRGTLRVGDVFVAGSEWGRVRALVDSQGENVDEAGPSMPVEVLGLGGAPLAGDEFSVVEDDARAREITDYRQGMDRDKRIAGMGRGTLEQMFSKIQAGELNELPIVIKGDVQGSVEAIIGALEKLGTDEVGVRVLHSGVGGITESDVTLAEASGAIIIGFNIRANAHARDFARSAGVEIRHYSIIYELVDDIRAALSGMLAPRIEEHIIASANVLEVFGITKVGKIAGCRVSTGTVRRNARARLLRDSVIVYDGGLRSLKRFKEDVREVREGNECGIALENYQDLQPGDVLEIYEVEEVQRQL